MHIPLRIGNFDTAFLELAEDLVIKLALQHAGTIRIFPCPNPKVEDEGAVRIIIKKNIRLGILENAGIPIDNFEEDLFDLLGVLFVGHADMAIKAHVTV